MTTPDLRLTPTERIDAAIALIGTNWRRLREDQRNMARRRMALNANADHAMTPQTLAVAALGAAGIVSRWDGSALIIPSSQLEKAADA